MQVTQATKPTTAPAVKHAATYASRIWQKTLKVLNHRNDEGFTWGVAMAAGWAVVDAIKGQHGVGFMHTNGHHGVVQVLAGWLYAVVDKKKGDIVWVGQQYAKAVEKATFSQLERYGKPQSMWQGTAGQAFAGLVRSRWQGNMGD